MNLQMSLQETAFLREVLGSYIGEMHTEIVHTDNFDLKEHLKFKRQTLQGILDRIETLEDIPA